MPPYGHMLALALLYGDLEPGAVNPTPDVTRALLAEALAREFMDERETGSFFQQNEDFVFDVRAIKARRGELEDAPAMAHVWRLPPVAVLRQRREFNRAVHDWLTARLSLNPNDPKVNLARDTNQRLFHVYDALCDAATPEFYVVTRRKGLFRAILLLREDGLTLEQLPPSVPVWAFTSAD